MSFQAKLTTKLTEFSVDDAIVEMRNQVDPEELNQLVRSLLEKLDKYDEQKLAQRNFDFLIGGRLLRLNVEEHLKLYSDEIDANEILNEKLVEVEYILSLEPPKPLEAVQHDDWVSCVDANDSYIISGSYDNSIRIFSINDRKNLITIKEAHEKPVTKVKFVAQTKQTKAKKSNDVYFISCGHDEVSILRKFNTKTLKVEPIFTYKGHNRSVNCVDIFDDLAVTGSFDKTLRLWSISEDDQDEGIEENGVDAAAGEAATRRTKKRKTSEKSATKKTSGKSAIMTLTGHHESVTGVRWLGGCNGYNSVASCSMDRSICVWDVEVGECKRRVNSSKPILGIDYCDERNLIISASCDRFVRLWDMRAADNSSAKTAYTSHTAWVSSVAFGRASTNHFISGGYDNVVKLWDIRSSKACLYDLIGHHDKVLDVNWSNPAFALSGSADSTLKIFATK
uniref:Ribosome biogenesis protein WDR12 n=1 Tax=Aceria tosichella TaxID=561515 RepID=A0A6G1SMJ6_9ACAR